MAPRVRLVAVFLFALAVVPLAAVTACGSGGNSSSPCDVVSKMDSMEIQIAGPEVHGCDTAAHKTVSGLTTLGLVGAPPQASPLFPALQYGAPAPTDAPVCTVITRDETWGFYDDGGSNVAAFLCNKMLKDPAVLRVLNTFTGSPVHVGSQ